MFPRRLNHQSNPTMKQVTSALVAVTVGLVFCLSFVETRKISPCGHVCMIYCEFGNVMDDRGCPTCQCNPPPRCRRSLCPMWLKCPFGFADDINGCQTCKCRDGPSCPEIKCTNKCPGGMYKKDKKGCDTCDCEISLPVCPDQIMCPLKTRFCVNGLATDSRGCTICECKPVPTPAVTVKPHDCRPLFCPMYMCPFGFADDQNGCPSCECKDIPIA